MYCAEQIQIPLELGTVLKQFTKAVILEEPKELYKWSANYFAQLANLPAVFGPNGEYLDGVMYDMKNKPAKGEEPAPEGDTAGSPMDQDPEHQEGEQVGQEGDEPEQEQEQSHEEDPEQEQEQADLVNEIFTRYNTEDGRINQETVNAIFDELQQKLSFEITEADLAQYMADLPTDEEGMCSIADVYNLFFQQDGEEA